MYKRNIIAQFDGGGGSDGTKKVYGVHIVDAKTGNTLHVAYGLLPNVDTFNTAEWVAAKTALAICWLFKDDISGVVIQGDSQLVIKQLNGEYKCCKPHLIPFLESSREIADKLLGKGISVEYNWVRREKNGTADELGRLI